LRHKHPPSAAEPAPAAPAAPLEPPISEQLRIDLIRLELGYGLLALAGGGQARLTEQIKGLRRSIASEMGFVLPPVRIQDNMELAAETYAIRIKEMRPDGASSARPGCWR
jgi:flagellar biosynthesis protein FlhA